jgi:hypothetical protein
MTSTVTPTIRPDFFALHFCSSFFKNFRLSFISKKRNTRVTTANPTSKDTYAKQYPKMMEWLFGKTKTPQGKDRQIFGTFRLSPG